MSLRVLLLCPAPLGMPGGNAVTVSRIARLLGARGVRVRAVEAGAGATGDGAGVRSAVGGFRPDVVHAFHAWRTGPLGRALADAQDAPLVLTLTGTDVSHDLADPVRGPQVAAVLESADAITAFDASVAAEVSAALPAAGALHIVPQSVDFPAVPAPAPAMLAGAPCVVFPAGIRPVKRPTLPLVPLEPLMRRHPRGRLWYLGPVLDPAEHDRLREALVDRPWARHLGVVAHAAMPAVLRRADIVLNCSRSEGGMANAVLEALALGRAVLASDIPGNRSLVEDGVTGYLFGTGEELTDKALRLAADPSLRERLGRAGQQRVLGRFTAEAEANGYLSVYERARARGARR